MWEGESLDPGEECVCRSMTARVMCQLTIFIAYLARCGLIDVVLHMHAVLAL